MYSISSAGARLNGLIRGNTQAARAVKRNLYLGRQINTDVIMQGVSTPNPTESLVAVNRNGRYIKRAGPPIKGYLLSTVTNSTQLSNSRIILHSK